MKILLINPPPRTPQQANVLVPPLGLAYLAASLEKAGFPVEILDANALGLTWQEFRAAVAARRAGIIGLTGMTPTIDTTLKAAKICRPYCHYLILGGPHASVFKTKILPFDFVIVGEAELALVKLLKKIEAHQPVKKIIFSQPIKNLDSLPFPARHLLPNHLYRYSLVQKYPFTTMFTSRGCPYQCLFCDKAVFGNQPRLRSAKNVLLEIEELVKKHQIKSIVFFDDLFTLNRQRVIKICKGIIKAGWQIDWKAEARVDTIDLTMLKLMKKAGCSLLAYGVESANQKSLDFLQKKITLKQIKSCFDLTHKAGIKTLGYFILGIPNETYHEAQKTIKLALDLKCDFAQFSLLTAYPGSPLYPLALKHGWLKKIKTGNPFDQELEKSALVTPNWSAENLNKILKEAYLRFYSQPKNIFKNWPLFWQNKERILKWLL